MRGNLAIFPVFRMSDWEQMSGFIAQTHGEQHVLRNRPLFDWFFLRNGNGELANLIVAYEGDKLISLLGYMPTRFLWGTERIDGAWMAHWMTMKGYRNGIGALLMKKITEMFPVVAGQGASLMNQEIVTKMKFKFLEKIRKVVYLFNPDAVKQRFGYVAERPAVTRETSDVPEEGAGLNWDDFDPDWNLYPSLRYGTLRDAAYLKFRYADYPFFKYHVFVEGRGCDPVVLVARIVETDGGLRVARILEFFFPEHESGRLRAASLLQRTLNFFEQRGCDYADFFCNSPAYLDFFVAAGFEREDLGALPSLLDPIDMSRKYQNLELFVAPALRARYPDCEDEFIVMRADGDQDRPNRSYRNP